MRRGFRLLTWAILLAVVGSAFASLSRGTAAPRNDPPGPDRFTVTTVDYTKYTWWMIDWGKTEPECEIKIDHEGMPTPGDVYVDCGEELYQIWVDQKPCSLTDVTLCEGVYFVLVDSQPAQKEISTKLPPPIVQVTLENCNPVYTSSTSICEFEPILNLTGVEPVPGYEIIGIEGLYEGQPFNCGPICRLKLPITGEEGRIIQFWAYSSYGDSSEVFEAVVRVAETNEGDPDRSFWYVDVLSSQWVGVPVASCVQTWEALPPVGGPPEWLSTPTQSEQLGSEVSYNYLAANLIKSKVVDASFCEDNGLLPDGGANNCGMEAARGAVTEWQNQFDALILNVAQESGVPAHLLKNLFAKESQFWPGIGAKDDVGLGQLTEHGADTALLWNPPFYYQFCPLVMDSGECAKGYLHLDKKQQVYVRQSLIAAVNATCADCPLGIDVDRANFSIGVFAHTLLANCEQAGQLVKNVKKLTAGQAVGSVATYEDLWKFSLVNYNAGPGCLGDALQATDDEQQALTWENVSTHLTPACVGAVQYVNDISQ